VNFFRFLWRSYRAPTYGIKSYRPLLDVTIAGPPRCPVWCRLVTVPTFPFTTFTRPYPFLSEWAKCQPGNTRNGGTVLPIANLMADYESGTPSSCLRFIVCGENYGGGLCGRGFVPSVYRRWALFGAPSCLSLCKIWTKSDNPRPSHSDLANWTIFEAGVHGPFHTLRDPVFHAHTKLGEDILIGGGKNGSKMRSARWCNIGVTRSAPVTHPERHNLQTVCSDGSVAQLTCPTLSPPLRAT